MFAKHNPGQHMQRHVIVVRADWDAEARVWVATSGDLPGLVTEAETQEALVDKLHVMIPDLLEDEGMGDEEWPEVPFVVMSEHLAKGRLRS